MKPQITVITIGVNDLEKSLEFYRDGLGLPTKDRFWGGYSSAFHFCPIAGEGHILICNKANSYNWGQVNLFLNPTPHTCP